MPLPHCSCLFLFFPIYQQQEDVVFWGVGVQNKHLALSGACEGKHLPHIHGKVPGPCGLCCSWVSLLPVML